VVARAHGAVGDRRVAQPGVVSGLGAGEAGRSEGSEAEGEEKTGPSHARRQYLIAATPSPPPSPPRTGERVTGGWAGGGSAHLPASGQATERRPSPTTREWTTNFFSRAAANSAAARPTPRPR